MMFLLSVSLIIPLYPTSRLNAILLIGVVLHLIYQSTYSRDAVYNTIEKLYQGTHLPHWCEFTLTDPEEILRFGQALIENCQEGGDFTVDFIDSDDDFHSERFDIYNLKPFIELMQSNARIVAVDTGVWETHSLIFPQTHHRIFDLSIDTGVFAEPTETEVSQKDLQIFINYCQRVAENKKLCFGYHVDKIESVYVEMY